MKLFVAGSVLILAAALHAQVPQSPQAPQAAQAISPASPAPQAVSPAPAADAGAAKPASFLGGDIPSFDPGSNILTWDGKSWNIANNELFQARFEKYLEAPEETGEQDKKYQAIISNILADLAPGNVTPKSIDEAFRLLPLASSYETDARLCDTLADAVYSAWKAQDAGERLEQANAALEEERKRNEWNTQVVSGETTLDPPAPSGKNAAAIAQWQKNQEAKKTAEMQPYVTRLAEVEAMIKKNQLQKELDGVQMKVEFQALMVQFFMQRRFQHVLMATRFYTAIFNDGDTKLLVGKDTHDLFANTSGMPPTVGTIDSLANEAIRDVREGVQAFEFLLKNDQMDGATKRLAEAFVVGEYMPEMRTLPRVEKQRALVFIQQSNQLISAINVKDYTLAEKLVHDLQATAKDFDSSKPMAAIETAKTLAGLHIAKAQDAAISGDKVTLEKELGQAVEIWPRNPALKAFTDEMFSQGNRQDRALADLDDLLSQHNYRQIYDEKMRFIAAVSTHPKRAQELQVVLGVMQKIETAIMEANANSQQGNYPGAWETVEKTFNEFPDDSKLNDLRATLTTEVPSFVHTLTTARDLEQKDEVGSSLAWYLKAQKIYPASEFAQQGIDRLVKKIMPKG